MPVDVRASEIHGQGLFAARPLPANTPLGSYAGRRLSPEEIEAMDWDPAITYLFGLSDGTVIDGAVGGNALRHLNHSCAPNCEAVETQAPDGTLHLDIVTLREIAQDEELFIDYALDIDPQQSPATYPCMCASSACRGSMTAG